MKELARVSTSQLSQVPAKAPARAAALYAKAISNAVDGTTSDLMVAKMMIRAAEIGCAAAVYSLATWKLFGREGVFPKDLREGNRLLRIAAEAGVSSAMFDLAVSLETGAGIRKTLPGAFRWYLRAALAGDVQAYRAVGRCLYWGIGTHQDRKVAYIWLDKADELQP